MSEPAESVRESIEAAIAQHSEPAPETPVAEPVKAEVVDIASAQPAKADRARDEHGRFAKDDDKPKAEAQRVAEKPVAEVPPPAAVEAPKPTKARPSSWRKDMDEHWRKLDPSVQEYILSREGQFASGVSTYKAEADRAKEINDAMAPYQAFMAAHNVRAADVVGRALGLHHQLLNGGPAQKVQMMHQLMRDYGIDPSWMGVQGAQAPQVDPNLAWLTQQVQQLRQQQTEYMSAHERAQQQQVEGELSRFAAAHEHFEAVRETMAGLLQAGLSETLDDAYKAALRHPRHSDIYDAMHEQQRAADEQKRAADAAAAAARARQAAVSVKSSSPTGSTAKAQDGPKSIRETIEQQVRALGGRV